MENVIIGIYTKFTELVGGVHNTFYTSIGGRLYLEHAPQNTAYPYATYYLVTSTPYWVMSNQKDFEDAIIQFNIYSENPSAVAEITGIATKCNALYHQTPLTITGYTHLWTNRSMQSLMRDEDDDWQYIIEFELGVRETS